MGLLYHFKSLYLFQLTHLVKGGFFLAIFLSFFLSDSEVPILRPNIMASFLFERLEHRDIKSAFGVCRPRCFVSKILDLTQFIIPKRSV